MAASLRHPLFRSYGVNMPSSLTTLLPMALGFSPHLPVSVCGTGALRIQSSFLATTFLYFPTKFQSLSTGATNARLEVRSCVNDLKLTRRRNFHRLCIDYAFRPRLSSRLTLGGRTCPRKPQIFGLYDSHANLATHSGILTSVKSTSTSVLTSPLTERSPTQCFHCPSFGYMLSPVKFSAQHRWTSELLRTL